MKLVLLSLVAGLGLFAASAGIASADDPDDDWDWDWNHFSDHHHDDHDHDDDDDDCRIIGAAFGAGGGAVSWIGGGWAGNWGGTQAFSAPEGCNVVFVFVPAGANFPGMNAGSMYGGFPGGFPGYPGGHLMGQHWLTDWEWD